MRFGDLEALLIELSGGDSRSVVGRFRNLRQMPFPDAIRTGTGNRVEYDLPRILALCAAFELNATLIPQTHAVAIVQDVWPELVRAFIAGAVALGVIQRPTEMPAGTTAVASISPDGFSPEPRPAATATLAGPAAGWDGDDAAVIRIDCGRLLSRVLPHLTACSDDPDGATQSFTDLDRSFGWSIGPLPHRAMASEVFGGSSFLDQGPYFERAAAFLKLAEPLTAARETGEPPRRRSRAAAQNLIDYLGRPAPIDGWKAEAGSEEDRPRLKHLLAAIGEAAGLTPPVLWPATILATGSSLEAFALVSRALSGERAARAAWIEAARAGANAKPRGKSRSSET